MRPQPSTPLLSPDQNADIEQRWRRALPFFQNHGSVLFLNPNDRFWEPHGFVQQSLARLLTENGVEVLWLDGAGWRSYHPQVESPHSNLKVRQLFQWPGRRFRPVDSFNATWQAREISQILKRMQGRPLVWVQSGLDERIAEKLDRIDIYSVFDDPYRQPLRGALCEKARLITCQNRFAEQRFSEAYPQKTRWLLPPVDLREGVFNGEVSLDLPPHFPERVMGYVGTFTPDGFDLVLFENFLLSFPDWGFVLAGRTDGAGEAWVERLRRYPNFCRLPWMPRAQLKNVWRRIDLNLLLYRPNRSTDGAFPTKIVEALYFGLPSVATHVPKTSSLEGLIPRTSFPDRLKALAATYATSETQRVDDLYRYFAYEMDPKLHLARVAEALAA